MGPARSSHRASLAILPEQNGQSGGDVRSCLLSILRLALYYVRGASCSHLRSNSSTSDLSKSTEKRRLRSRDLGHNAHHMMHCDLVDHLR
jgi:hypothetical protein